MGNVDEGITSLTSRRNSDAAMFTPSQPARIVLQGLYCSGGCAANGYHAREDIRSNYEIGCELQRKRVECAIMIKAALAED